MPPVHLPLHRSPWPSLGACALASAGILWAGEPATGTSLFPNPLRIPPILKPAAAGGIPSYDLTAHAGTTRFLTDPATPTYGYNDQSYLGPTLRLTRGRQVRITLHNELPADFAPPMPMAMPESRAARLLEPLLAPYATSLRIHGLQARAEIASLAPQGQASLVFTPDQPAATLWYHPAPLLDAGRQVYLGLGGLILLDDPRAAGLNLPHAYGVDDLPLIVQDRRFGPDSRFLFRDRKEDVEGMLGNRILVNGTLTPHAAVAATRVRLRLVNASNARSYLFAFRDGRSFRQIASDAGFLDVPQASNRVLVAPGGRAEIVADFSRDSGSRVHLVSLAFKAAPVRNPLALPNGGNFPIMEFQVGAVRPSRPVQGRLAKLPPADSGHAQDSWIIGLERGGEDDDSADGDTSLDGRHFDPSRIDHKVRAGSWEVWTLINHSKDSPHAFHLEGTPFRVLSRNNAALTVDDQGPKDTLQLAPRETARILLHFGKQVGVYRFECENLEAVDQGMAGQYQISAR
jgi:FtsP/CotA-like multicopper oxidase with cupredoxin domain